MSRGMECRIRHKSIGEETCEVWGGRNALRKLPSLNIDINKCRLAHLWYTFHFMIANDTARRIAH